MKKTVFLLLLLPFAAWSQKHAPHLHEEAELSHLPLQVMHLPAKADAQLYLRQEIWPQADWQWKEIAVRRSPHATYRHYRLYWQDRPIFFGQLLWQEGPGETQVLRYPVLNGTPPAFDLPRPPALPKADGVEEWKSAEAGWLHHEGQWRPTWRFEAFGRDGLHQDWYYQSDGWEMRERRLFNGDTVAQGQVFFPDPLTRANVFYGGAYVDQNDADRPELNQQRVMVRFPAQYRNGRFVLENAHLAIADFSPPNIPPVTSVSGTFDFTRAEDGFEDVNALYHLSEMKAYVDALGYNLPTRQIEADVHAINGADQSYYVPSEGRLYFGEGGVDDAEDADVIVHEYGHAIINDAIASLAVSNERASLEEALCDYLAVSYSKRQVAFQTDRVFNWDGHNPFWPGRMATTNKRYSQVNFNFSIYEHTDLMVACLMDLEASLGAGLTHKLLLESFYSLTTNTGFDDFARLLIDVDQQLENGLHRYQIASPFILREILPASIALNEKGQNQANDLAVFALDAFAEGGSLRWTSRSGLREWRLYNLQGQVLDQAKSAGARGGTLSGDGLPAGLYHLELISAKGRAVVSLLRR